MAYEFPADIQERLHAQIALGHFQSEDDVLREAMNTLEKRQEKLHQLRDMVAAAEEDIRDGRIAPFDANQTKAVVRERLRKEGRVE